MRDLLRNQKGIVYVSIIFISLIIFVILTSLLYLVTNNMKAVSSNKDNYMARYIAESILELKTAEIMELSDEVIMEYLLDLKNYKIKYIEEATDNSSISYSPPDFSKYVHQKIIPNIKKLSGTVNKPFKDYKDNHYFKIEIEYNSTNKTINIAATGNYKKARVFIKSKLEPPKIISNGFDEYNLPRINVLPINIVEYYQTFGK